VKRHLQCTDITPIKGCS